MLYYPVKGNYQAVGLIDAIHIGITREGTLFLPQSYPLIPMAYYNNIASMTLPEIGFVVANMLMGTDIPSATLKDIVDRTLTFDIPFCQTAENRYVLDLTKGPTGNYNDISARFLANVLRHYRRRDRFNVIIASSTGAGHAVADAFHDMDGVKSFILFPSGSLSARRSSAITAYGKNVIPVNVRGSLYNLLDAIRHTINDGADGGVPMITANSVNIAALLPRTIFFLYAYARLIKEKKNCKNIVISIPTRNLGNLTAAIIAAKMGLPVSRYLALLDEDRYAVNDSRVAALLGENASGSDIFSPKTHPLRADETEITLLTDDDSGIKIRKTADRQPVCHISAAYAQLRNIINEHK